MSAVVDPFAGCGDPLAGGDARGVADDGHQIAVATRLRSENAEAVLGIVESDTLNEAGEHFLCRWLRIGLHTDRRILTILEASALRRWLHSKVTTPLTY